MAVLALAVAKRRVQVPRCMRFGADSESVPVATHTLCLTFHALCAPRACETKAPSSSELLQMATPLEAVQEMLRERLAALDIDADAYTEYVATAVCDEDVPMAERRSQLLSMFAETLEDPDSVALSLSDVISEALLLFEHAKASQPVIEPPVILHARAPRAVVPAASSSDPVMRQLRRDDKGSAVASECLDAATKRAILAQIALEGGGTDEESDGGAGAARGRVGGKPRRRARDGGGGGIGGASKTLDDALGEISQLSLGGSGGDTADLGRRAKRAAARAAEAGAAPAAAAGSGRAPRGAGPTAAAPAGRRAVAVSDDPAMLLGGAHAGTVARLLGRAGGGAGGQRRSQQQDRDADAADIIGARGSRGAAAAAAAGRRPGRAPADEAEEEDADDDGGGGTGPPPPPSPPSGGAPPRSDRLVLDYDPMAAPRPDNRAFARGLQREAADAMRAQHEAEEAQRRQASEAAR